jgi:hypothetical protein
MEKMAYTDDELALLASTPQMIGSAIAMVGSSGLFGTGKELFASASSMMEGVKTFPGNALIRQLVPDVQADPQQAMDKIKKFRDWGLARIKQKGIDSADKVRALTLEDCKAVSALLAAKATPQEANEYKQWALSVAEKVAAAASEGGFLGFGGERVSDTERQLIAQIRTALGETTATA